MRAWRSVLVAVPFVVGAILVAVLSTLVTVLALSSASAGREPVQRRGGRGEHRDVALVGQDPQLGIRDPARQPLGVRDRRDPILAAVQQRTGAAIRAGSKPHGAT